MEPETKPEGNPKNLAQRLGGTALSRHKGRRPHNSRVSHRAKVKSALSSCRQFLIRRNQRFGVHLAVICLIAAGILGAAYYQNAKADSLFKAAQTDISKGHYKAAQMELDKAYGYYSFGGTRLKIDKLRAQNNRWVTDQNNLDTAQSLYSQKRYNDARTYLFKIGKDFPGYSQVASLDKAIATKTAKTALKNKSTAPPVTRGSAPKTKSSSAAKTFTAGKRFVSTAAASSLATATTIIQAQQALQSFVGQYGLTVEISSVNPSSYVSLYDTYDTLQGKDLSLLKSYGELFIDEWAKYPKSLITASKLKYIALVKNFATQGVYRAAGPDPFGEAMYYDVGFSGDYAREVVHHEFDHLIEYNIFNSYHHSDPAWLSYNPPGFNYGNGGASCYQPNNSCLSGEHPIPGFVTGYGASAIEEDKAEIYAYLMEGTYYHHLKKWLSGDSSLKNKVNSYKKFLSSLSPEMSGSYYDQINP